MAGKIHITERSQMSLQRDSVCVPSTDPWKSEYSQKHSHCQTFPQKSEGTTHREPRSHFSAHSLYHPCSWRMAVQQILLGIRNRLLLREVNVYPVLMETQFYQKDKITRQIICWIVRSTKVKNIIPGIRGKSDVSTQKCGDICTSHVLTEGVWRTREQQVQGPSEASTAVPWSSSSRDQRKRQKTIQVTQAEGSRHKINACIRTNNSLEVFSVIQVREGEILNKDLRQYWAGNVVRC